MSKKAKKKPTKANGFRDEVSFKVGDFVGAKVKGYPCWPGRIEKVDFMNKKCKYTVRFFGTNDSSQSFMHIIPFKDFTEKDKACKNKGFQEALAICMEELESSASSSEAQKVDNDDKHSPSRQSTTASPFQEESNLVIKEEPVERPQKKDNVNRRAKVPTASKPSSRESRQRNKQTTLTEIPKTKVGGKFIHPKSPKSEGENVLVTPDPKTIAKLKEKVEKKEQEKEACKNKMKEVKLSKKISEKLNTISKNLERILKVLGDILNAKTPDLIKINKWKESVRTYNSVIKNLGRCIHCYVKSPHNYKLTNHNECRMCHEKLIELVRETKKGLRMQPEIKNDLKKIRKIKDEPDVKEFLNNYDIIFSNSKNAMLERKENDAE